MATEQEFILPVTEEEYESAGSKFITFPPGSKVGDVQYRDIECGMLDWDTPGKSMKIEITVTEEGVDNGKAEKISFGVDAKGIWKGKQIYKAITGEDMPMKKGADGKSHPAPKAMATAGKAAVGVWFMNEGKKGGVGETVYYPKLQDVLPEGSKPNTESLM